MQNDWTRGLSPYLIWLIDPDRPFKDDPPPDENEPTKGIDFSEYDTGEFQIDLSRFMDGKGNLKFTCSFCLEHYTENEIKPGDYFSKKRHEEHNCPHCGVVTYWLGWNNVTMLKGGEIIGGQKGR